MFIILSFVVPAIVKGIRVYLTIEYKIIHNIVYIILIDKPKLTKLMSG